MRQRTTRPTSAKARRSQRGPERPVLAHPNMAGVPVTHHGVGAETRAARFIRQAFNDSM